ncbi:antiviral RADAR system adenosine triphosphatase RdrA [Pseudomonas entomophila]|uniref:antiviral RADAR system adenosine triphosphatase RdrA n=1 Tax=Pseudomonas entomophila TaxID=312306 RepID=UPI001F02A148|nr:antiviral RADAR system adenosine triphosphatase RdrA [Pseudomonas entomophila]MCG8291282.1 hypothetical protein [Pseudomonas entomophila]
MSLASDFIYLPLDQGERAGRLTVNQLLARGVYRKMAQILWESLPGDVEDESKDATRYANERGHMTLFLDGGRGMGKTTVIVNLAKYLEAVEDQFPGLAEAVHVLKPIDPSQLEDGDDLFLNVVVAAVLGDGAVKAQREVKPELWQALHDSLQALGVALSGRESQGDGIGLDRLRAFMGSQELAGAVHDFFAKAARLLGKKMLVLPIDDVDTTLHRAFENLEVVRRYLASPALLPIVCGDLKLYREVTSRDTYRRLSMGSTGFGHDAKSIAEDLAKEYLRKILPLHRRMRMPEVDEFLQSSQVLLGAEQRPEGKPRLALNQLIHWLTALLAGPVNNNENSTLAIPISTVRALSQLLARVQSEVINLERAFFRDESSTPEVDLMRRMSGREQGRLFDGARGVDYGPRQPSQVSLTKWRSELLNHFSFESSAGAACLVLLALQHWDETAGSVLDTPLFQPLRQLTTPELRYIETRSPLAWGVDLGGRLPESWLRSLQDESVLPYATPEVGRAVVPDNWEIKDAAGGALTSCLNLMVELVTHHNFYSTSKRATLICCGRVVELVVTSLVRDVTVEDVYRITASAPYHSAVSVAATKAVHFSLDQIEYEEIELVDESAPYAQFAGEESDARHAAINALVHAINNWRVDVSATALSRSPWLIYCALNKTFNQIPLFNRPLKLNAQPKAERLSDVAASGLSAFNAFWAAVASFEKGPLFGMGVEISTVNLLNRRGDFSQNNLFTQNIKPFLSRGKVLLQNHSVIAVTGILEHHPVRMLLQSLYDVANSRETSADAEELKGGRIYLLERLGLPLNIERMSSVSIKRALKVMAEENDVSPKQFGQALLADVASRYPGLPQLKLLRKAIATLDIKRPS